MVKVHQQRSFHIFPKSLSNLKVEFVTKAARGILDADPALCQLQTPQICLLSRG